MLTSDVFIVLIPIALIISVIASYATFIVKFKPKIETESEKSKIVKKVQPLPTESKNTTKQKETRKSANVEPKLLMEEEILNTKKKKKKLTKVFKKLMRDSKIRKTQKRKAKKEELEKKSFLLFGTTEFEGCPHFFGHLHNLVEENKPIPDECYGCPKMMECA